MKEVKLYDSFLLAQTIKNHLSLISEYTCIFALIYNQTGSYIAVEVAELAIFAIGTLWMMWVIRSYKLKKPLDEQQQQKVFNLIQILTNSFWMTITITQYKRVCMKSILFLGH